MTMIGDRLYGTEIAYCYAGLVSRTELFKREYPMLVGKNWQKLYALWYMNGYKTYKNRRNVK